MRLKVRLPGVFIDVAPPAVLCRCKAACTSGGIMLGMSSCTRSFSALLEVNACSKLDSTLFLEENAENVE